MKFLNNKIFSLLASVVVLETIFLLLFFLNRELFGSFDSKSVKPSANYHYKDSLTCAIVQTTLIHRSTFFFRDLNSETPKVSKDSGVWLTYTKKYDANQYPNTPPDSGYIVLVNTENSFASDVFGIWKDNGLLVHTATGATGGDWRDHQAVAEKGRCE